MTYTAANAAIADSAASPMYRATGLAGFGLSLMPLSFAHDPFAACRSLTEPSP